MTVFQKTVQLLFTEDDVMNTAFKSKLKNSNAEEESESV